MSTSDEIRIERKTDQWGADDFLSGPRVFTIRAVKDGKTEFGRYDISLVEGGDRVWRPPNTVIELLMKVWGTNKKADWVGRRVELYRDASVRSPSGGEGGIRVSAVSHITSAAHAQVMVSQGKRAKLTVQPLPDTAPAAPVPLTVEKAADLINSAVDLDNLRGIWGQINTAGLAKTPELIDAKEKRKEELT